MARPENENPALQRGAFDDDQSQQQPVGITYIAGARSDQLVASEHLVEQQIACFSASCDVQACLVWNCKRDQSMGMTMAKCGADEIGLTRALGVEAVGAMLNEMFPAAMDDARAGRIKESAAREVFDRRLMAVFEALCTHTVLRVQNREITYEYGAKQVDEFVNLNGRLTARFSKDSLRRIVTIAFSKLDTEAA